MYPKFDYRCVWEDEHNAPPAVATVPAAVAAVPSAAAPDVSSAAVSTSNQDNVVSTVAAVPSAMVTGSNEGDGSSGVSLF